ncbi:MAG: histidine kinase [Bacteroidota bacterium]
MNSLAIKWLLSNRWQNRVLQHTLFWLLSFGLLLRLFAFGPEIFRTDMIFTAIFHLSLLFLVYTNLKVGIPYFLGKGRSLIYLFFSITIILFSILINQFSFNTIIDVLFPEYFFISEFNFWELGGFMITYLVASSLLKLSKAWFQVTEAKEALEAIKKEKTQAELSALKLQVNPHFLFNSLNSLYSLALYQDVKTPELILRLSNAMRYMLYESNGDKVMLKNEIDYLDNYIELQRIRTDDSADIRFEVNGAIDNQKIAPLLLIPFIENGFKHGIKGETDKAFIHIQLKIEGEYVYMSVENNVGETDLDVSTDYGGIGLKNVKRRLELMYPSRYNLEIKEDNPTFRVTLNLKLE